MLAINTSVSSLFHIRVHSLLSAIQAKASTKTLINDPTKAAIGLFACALFTSPTLALDSVIDGMELAPALSHALIHRVDFVGLGDSNQLFQGNGFDHGITLALSNSFTLYATGLTTPGDNRGAGSGVGYRSYVLSIVNSSFRYEGAPSVLDQVMPGSSELLPNNYIYLPFESFVPGTQLAGMGLTADSPLGVAGPLRCVYVYGTFEAAPGSNHPTSTFTPVIRIDDTPFTILARGPALSTTSSPRAGIKSFTLNVPADPARAAPIGMRWTDPAQPRLNGPFIAYYQRIERPDRVNGVAFNTLYAFGGQSARDMAQTLIAAPNAQLKAYFAIIRDRQADVPLAQGEQPPARRIIVRINAGLNDRNEPLASVGINRIANGRSPAAYADNLQAIIDRLREIWTISNWPADELYFVLTPPHPITPETDDPPLNSYRDAAQAVAQANPRCACVRLERLITSTEMLANNWYFMPGDQNHLSVAGYIEVSTREIAALRAAAGL